MKNALFVFLISFFSSNIWSQDKVELKLDNPYPRVGEKVSVLFSGKFLSQEKNASYDEKIEFSNLSFKESREYKVGPFGFVFDEKQYSTNSINVSVEPKLPFEEGIWVRAYEEEEHFILIIEQQIKLEKTVTYNSHGYESSFQTTKEFAKINPKSESGVYFYMKKSSSKSITENEEDLLSDHYNYSIQIYSMELSSIYSKGFKLTPKHFINFPKEVSFTPITIQPTKKL